MNRFLREMRAKEYVAKAKARELEIYGTKAVSQDFVSEINTFWDNLEF